MFTPNDMSYFARMMAMRGGMPGYSGMMRGQGLLSGPFNGNLQGAPMPQMPPWFQRPGSVSYGPGPAPMPQSPMPQPMPQSTMPQPQNAMGLNGSPYQGNFGGAGMQNQMLNANAQNYAQQQMNPYGQMQAMGNLQNSYNGMNGANQSSPYMQNLFGG